MWGHDLGCFCMSGLGKLALGIWINGKGSFGYLN